MNPPHLPSNNNISNILLISPQDGTSREIKKNIKEVIAGEKEDTTHGKVTDIT